MSNNNGKDGYRANTGSQTFKMDFSILDQHLQHPTTPIIPSSRSTNLGRNALTLKTHAVLPEEVPAKYPNRSYSKLFDLHITPRNRGALLLRQLENIYVTYQTNRMGAHMKPDELQRLFALLRDDPVGVVDIPSNQHVWKLEKRPRVSTNKGVTKPSP